MPTLRQLEVFLTVAQEGSIGRAADALGISQPGVSKQIKSLEGLVGQPLFVRRRGAPSQLSDLGREMVSRAQLTIELQRQFHKSPDRGLAPACPSVSANPFLLARVTNQLPTLFPASGDLRPVFRVSNERDDVLAEIRNGEVDFQLTHLMTIPDDARLLTRILRLDSCGLYLSGGTDCAGDWTAPTDLNCVKWQLPNNSPRLSRWMQQLLEAAGVRRENIVESMQFVESIVVHIVEHGGGSVFMDRHAAPFVQSGRLVRAEAAGAPLYLVLLAGKDCDRGVFNRLADTLTVL